MQIKNVNSREQDFQQFFAPKHMLTQDTRYTVFMFLKGIVILQNVNILPYAGPKNLAIVKVEPALGQLQQC